MKNYIALFFILISCNYDQKQINQKELKQENAIKSDSVNAVKAKFQGVWAETEGEDAYFIVRGDSIYSVDDRNGLYYTIRDDSLIIDYGRNLGRHMILMLVQDSLVIKNLDGSIVSLYKR